MRKIVPLLIGAAILGASPAHAQNTDATANDTAVVANDPAAAPANDVVDLGTADPANDLAGVPVAADEPAPAPAPVERKPTFPWGVLGLIGLLGLIPRRRRG